MRTAAIAALALAVAAVRGTGQQPVPPRDTRPAAGAAATGRITGVVTSDETRPRPLRRARVTLTGTALSIGRSLITADDGTFTFEGVPPGRFTVGALKDGYVAMNYGATRTGRPGRGVEVAGGQSVRVTLRLPRGAVITGTVVDLDGQPAQGIAVTVLTRRFVSTEGDARYVAVAQPGPSTDDRGVYRAFGLPAGEYVVAAQPAGGRGLPPATAQPLRIISDGGSAERTVGLAQVFHPDTTDLTRASRILVRAGEERAGVDIQLAYVALTTISGTVPIVPGAGPALLTLTRLDDTTAFAGGRVARADADGRFSFASVPPGLYRVSARAMAGTSVPSGRGGAEPPGAALIASADVTATGDDISNLALSWQPALTISGRVVFEGTRPAPPIVETSVSVPLSLTAADSGYALPRVQLQAGGTFRLEGVTQGRYRGFTSPQGVASPIGGWWVRSLSAGGRELLDAPIELRENLTDVLLTLTDAASVVGGSVTDERGAPAPDAYVVAFTADRAMWFANSRRVVAVHPDRSGRYTIRNLPPGEYRVAVADLDQGEWFDPAALERLLPSALPLVIRGPEQKTVDLVAR